ncbi:hypothetical protein E8E14_012172 [Neopestalotiopsis sp. 37M]|nr:hypothetical protein E8E14_012172 [Neopestalotiopsis sp. 37M]
MLSQSPLFAFVLLLSVLAPGAVASTTLEKVILHQRNREHIGIGAQPNDNPPPPLTTTTTSPQATAPPPDPIPHPPVSSFTASCDDKYCKDGSRYCYYWAGQTSYEFGVGPVPGETFTVLGACTPVTTTLPASVVTQTITDAAGAVATVASTVPATVKVVEVWE